MAKKYDIDLFEVLKQADKKNYNYFSTLTEKEKTAFEPWVAMRFMSSGPDNFDGAASLLFTNSVLNEQFSIISKDKELFFRLMCTVGTGTIKRHYMPKPPKNKTISPVITEIVREFVNDIHSDEEVFIFLKTNDIDVDDLKELALDFNWPDSKIKQIKKSYDNLMESQSN